jgi:hypothetical protein
VSAISSLIVFARTMNEFDSFMIKDSPWTIPSRSCPLSSNQCSQRQTHFQVSSTNSSYTLDNYSRYLSNNRDLFNPFHLVTTHTSMSSIHSSSNDNYDSDSSRINHQPSQAARHYFEPLPFVVAQKPISYPQLSQKHVIIKQSTM